MKITSIFVALTILVSMIWGVDSSSILAAAQQIGVNLTLVLFAVAVIVLLMIISKGRKA